jgi:butyryl-CoA dehydrogenase
MDLLGRKVMRTAGASLELLREEVGKTCDRARAEDLDARYAEQLHRAMARIQEVSMHLLQQATQDPTAALSHSADYLDMLSTAVVAWQWLALATAAQHALSRNPGESDADFYRGELRAAQYWFHTELPRVFTLADLCESVEDSYLSMQDGWF